MFPAQSTVYQCDALEFLKRIHQDTFDLIYFDPPWGLQWSNINGDQQDSLERWIAQVAQHCWRVLRVGGSLYCHIPSASNHDFRVVFNQCFGTLPRASIAIPGPRSLSASPDAPSTPHEELILYWKGDSGFWLQQHHPANELHFPFEDENGRYRLRPLFRKNSGNRQTSLTRFKLPDGYSLLCNEQRIESLDQKGLIQWTAESLPLQKMYLQDTSGPIVGNLWDDITANGSKRSEQIFNRLLLQSTREGDWVFSPLSGSGGILKAAGNLGRKWTGCESLSPSSCVPHLPDACIQSLDLTNTPVVSDQFSPIFTTSTNLIAVRSSIEVLLSTISNIKSIHLHEDDDDIIRRLESSIPLLESLVPRAELDRATNLCASTVPCWKQLSDKSKTFLATSFSLIDLIGDGMDFSPIAVCSWKAVEYELVSNCLHPFREWVRHNVKDPTKDFVVSKSDRKDVPALGLLADFINPKNKEPPIGNLLACIEKAGTSTKDIQKYPVLRYYKSFLQESFANPNYLLDARNGVCKDISTDAVNTYRNGAAHTTLYERQKAISSQEVAIECLTKFFAAAAPREVD